MVKFKYRFVILFIEIHITWTHLVVCILCYFFRYQLYRYRIQLSFKHLAQNLKITLFSLAYIFTFILGDEYSRTIIILMRYTKIKSQLGIRFIRLPFTEFTHFSLRYFTILCGDYFHRRSPFILTMINFHRLDHIIISSIYGR